MKLNMLKLNMRYLFKKEMNRMKQIRIHVYEYVEQMFASKLID